MLFSLEYGDNNKYILNTDMKNKIQIIYIYTRLYKQ